MPEAKRIGGPRKTDLLEVVNAILYIATTGCQWRMVPKDLPSYSTVQNYFYEWRDDRTWSMINHALVMAEHERQDRETSTSVGVIDRQSVKTTEISCISGYDADRKIKGCKRQFLTDTLCLLISAAVHYAGIQDRDGAPDVLASISKPYPLAVSCLHRWRLCGSKA